MRQNALDDGATVHLAYLIPEQFWMSTVTSAAEVFHAMALQPGAYRSRGASRIEAHFLRTNPEPPHGFSGLQLETRYFDEPALRQQRFDVVMVPSVWNLSPANLERSSPALDWLRQQHAAGAVIVGLVTGAFFLAEAGLLDGCVATTHWASASHFRQRYPAVQLNEKLQITEADGIYCTSHSMATQDMAILLVQRFLGEEAAHYAATFFGLRDETRPLPEFLEPTTSDALVDAVRDRLKMNYRDSFSLRDLATQYNVSPRTLSRRFQAATGLGPMQYLLRHRLHVATRLLGSTTLAVEQVALQSGFQSATVFGRNFRREYGVSPRDYRKAQLC